MSHWMFNCKEVTRMVSESLDRQLPFHHRIGIRLHLLMCRFCSRFRSQLLTLNEAIRIHGVRLQGLDHTITLSQETKDRLKETLKREIGLS